MGNGIGELAESTLHNQLKHHYHEEGDILEYKLDGYYIDVKKPEELVEIQTSSFGSVKKKYTKLLKNGHTIRMVYPIAELKWLVKEHRSGKLERRKSPKKGTVYDVFQELVSIPKFLRKQNFILEVVTIIEEEIRVNDGKGSRRRGGWSIKDHKCLRVLNTHSFSTPRDFLDIIPNDLPLEFTSGDLASTAKIPKWLAQKMLYTLKHTSLISHIGKQGRYNLFQISQL